MNKRNEFFSDRVNNYRIKVLSTCGNDNHFNKILKLIVNIYPFTFNLVLTKIFFMNVTDIFNDIVIEQIPFFYV